MAGDTGARKARARLKKARGGRGELPSPAQPCPGRGRLVQFPSCTAGDREDQKASQTWKHTAHG